MILAREILTDARQVTTHAPALERGLVLLQLGRIARTLGDLDGALDLLHAAETSAAPTVFRSSSLERRREAVVARTRGTIRRRARCSSEPWKAGRQSGWRTSLACRTTD